MRENACHRIAELKSRYPIFGDIFDGAVRTVEAITECYRGGGKLLICGNGGSAADAEHIVGELMKGFVLRRKLDGKTREELAGHFPADAEYLAENLQGGLPAIALASHTALSTAFANDNAPDLVFAQQILGYGRRGDVLLAISTSGNSKNVIYAAQVARVKGVKVIGLTGADGGKLKELCDICVCVPETEPYKVQELHLPFYHAVCLAVEEEMFGK